VNRSWHNLQPNHWNESRRIPPIPVKVLRIDIPTYNGTHSVVYLDGEKIHDRDWGSQKGLVHASGAFLRVFNGAGASPFNGYIDDLTLWNRSLGQGEIRALNYLDRGLNGIVVPRGLFFQSQFFSNLNTTSFSYLSPLIGSIVMGNDNPLELNARTIQQLIAANLTLAEDDQT